MKQYDCSLHDLLEGTPNRRLPLPTALRVGAQLAHTVGELHEVNIILRDLKPQNGTSTLQPVPSPTAGGPSG
jgi:serine/threonine protein kinase